MSHKARLEPKEFLKKAGIEYTGTFAQLLLNCNLSTIRTVIAVANHTDMILNSNGYMKTAFLNGVLEEEVYMK